MNYSVLVNKVDSDKDISEELFHCSEGQPIFVNFQKFEKIEPVLFEDHAK